MFKLSPRLLCAAGLVIGGDKTVDVGTDHAYLPVYLLQSGKCGRVLACDIGEGPLENAMKTVKQYCFEDKAELRLSDGLKNVNPSEAEEIIICGMGGNLIERILSSAGWIKRQGTHLVLQPMTHSEDVRKYLCDNCFVISEEKCVFDDKRVYCCISAYYKNDIKREYDPGYYYFGTLLNKEGEAAVYVKKQIDRVKKRFDSLSAIGDTGPERNYLKQVIDYYERHKG